MKQSTRIQVAKETLQALQRGFYVNPSGKKTDISAKQRNAVDSTRLFRPGELDDLLQTLRSANNYDTVYEVTNETSLDAARRLTKAKLESAEVACLNFASAKNPGGGFLGGALAQEECIARASGLYPCLLKAKEYYEYHRNQKTCLYSDHMIYSPAVPVIKDEDGNLLDEPVLVSFITSPAVNAGVIRRNEENNIGQIKPAM